MTDMSMLTDLRTPRLQYSSKLVKLQIVLVTEYTGFNMPTLNRYKPENRNGHRTNNEISGFMHNDGKKHSKSVGYIPRR